MTRPTFDEMVAEFDRDVETLCRDTSSHFLRLALNTSPRQVENVAEALRRMRNSSFTTDEALSLVEIIKADGKETDIRADLRLTLAFNLEARRLLELYAEIHRAPNRHTASNPYYDWRKVPEIDTHTGKDAEDNPIEQTRVDTPLCFICGTKMRPAGSCYVCEGCGATSGV